VWWVGLLSLGEGWRNNHHAKPTAAVHGWHWYEIDISGYILRLLARAGLIWNLVRAPRRTTSVRQNQPALELITGNKE
jgi:stearoyl-CoA desaturase (Delta-9 desaturase)